MSKNAEYRRRYRETHPERVLEAAREWRAAHPGRNAESLHKYRQTHPEGAAASTRKWRQANRERVGEYLRRYRAENPEKVLARRAIATALRSGKITRPSSCSRCGAVGPVHAHHQDYAAPLEVQWICQACHRVVHASDYAGADE